MNKIKIINKISIFIIGFFTTITVFLLILSLFSFLNLLKISQNKIGVINIIIPFLLCLCTGIWEEIVFRKFLFGKLNTKLKSFWLSCLLTSLLFSVCHYPNIGYNYISFFSYLLGGVVYCVTFLRSKTIIYPISIHVAWNYSQFLFSLPMSSGINDGFFKIGFSNKNLLFFGTYGIENGLVSILMRLVILFFCYYIIKLLPKIFL